MAYRPFMSISRKRHTDLKAIFALVIYAQHAVPEVAHVDPKRGCEHFQQLGTGLADNSDYKVTSRGVGCSQRTL